MPQQTPILIVGSGSAGLCAATWLSIYKIPFLLLERRSGPMKIGQADGVQCRTVELFESFGISEELLRESYHVLELAFWNPDEKGGIQRTSRAADTERGLSHMPHVIMNQARMNGLLLEACRRFGGGREAEVMYGCEVRSVVVDEKTEGDPEAYAVSVKFEREGREEVIRAKYVLGCDGAHSLVRKSLGINMIGDTSDTVWGVMDVYPRTNFPDIRRKASIHSTSGNLIIIPREGGSLARFYLQLPEGSQPKDVKLEDLHEMARKIFRPYTMVFAETFWWSAYSIGQRLADQFHKDHRVFLTGDACHTHSPKAGQGMNVSMQDGYNIGWKLGMLFNGQASPEILKTYVFERAASAKELIDFDKDWAKMYSAKDIKPDQISQGFVKAGRYMAGLAYHYDDSSITSIATSRPSLARNVDVGMRFPSAQVVRFSDAKAMQLLRALPADGRWRVVVFAGDLREPTVARRLNELAPHLERLARRITQENADIDSFIEPIIVLHGKRVEMEQEQIPDYFWPITGQWKMRDLHKVFVDDEHYNSDHGYAYEKYGIDPAQGAVVIVRPDHYVSMITSLNDYDGIAAFFRGFALERQSTLVNGK